MNDEQRAAFEAWIRQRHPHLDLQQTMGLDGIEYAITRVQLAWSVWQEVIEHTKKVPLPCAYCSKQEFKGWSNGKCPYCGVAK